MKTAIRLLFCLILSFPNKQNIDWNEVEKYLERFVEELVEIAETGDVIYLGKDLPDEYAGL